MPFAWIRSINRDDFPSNASLFAVNQVPCLFLSSLKDQYIEAKQMDNLFGCCASEKKCIIQFPEADHSSNKVLPEYWDCLENFVIGILKERRILHEVLLSFVTWLM